MSKLVRRSTPPAAPAGARDAQQLAQAQEALNAFAHTPFSQSRPPADGIERPPAVPVELRDAEYDRMRLSIRLDKHKLEDNALEHAGVYLDICECSTLAQSVLDEMKEYRERVDASLARHKRLHPDKDEKITDKVVDAYVLGHTRHAQVTQEYADVWRMASRWKALERSFEHRKSMIRELASLYASGYWTSSATRSAHSDVAQRNADNTQAQLSQRRLTRSNSTA